MPTNLAPRFARRVPSRRRHATDAGVSFQKGSSSVTTSMVATEDLLDAWWCGAGRRYADRGDVLRLYSMSSSSKPSQFGPILQPTTRNLVSARRHQKRLFVCSAWNPPPARSRAVNTSGNDQDERR